MQALPIENLSQLDSLIASHPALLAIFFSRHCAICTAIEPKIIELVETHFPEIFACDIDCEAQPEVAGQHGVLSVPTIVVYFDGKESIRLTGSFSIAELKQRISRPYDLLFSG